MEQRSALGIPSTSPFSPHVGRAPQSLVGRDALLADLGGGLATGPRDARYTSILMGVRGSGKTVLLSEIEDRAASDGWVVLSLDAGTPGLLDRIVQTIRNADRAYEALGIAGFGTSRSVEKSVGIRLGPLAGEISTTEHQDRMAHMGLREHLVFLAQAALKSETSVLLTVDEMHGIARRGRTEDRHQRRACPGNPRQAAGHRLPRQAAQRNLPTDRSRAAGGGTGRGRSSRRARRRLPATGMPRMDAAGESLLRPQHRPFRRAQVEIAAPRNVARPPRI